MHPTSLAARAQPSNHDILDRAGLASSLGALVAAGLVDDLGGAFRTTRAGRRMKKHWRGGMFTWGPTLVAQLSAVPRPDVTLEPSEREWQDAYDAYRRRRRGRR